MIKELKEFIFRGNVLELAIAVIVAGAFGEIVSSFTSDIIMPPLGMALGGVDFSQMEWVLKAAEGDTPAVSIKYGKWLNTIINFLIIAVILFFVIQAAKRLNPPAPPAPAGPTDIDLLGEIRDLLKK